MLVRTVAVAMLLLAAMASAPGEARAVTAPDSARVAAMARSFASGPRMRLRTADGALRLVQANVTPEGIVGRIATGPGTGVTALDSEPRLVAWRDIEKAERSGSYARQGYKYGFFLGLGAATIVAANWRGDDVVYAFDFYGVGEAQPPTRRERIAAFTGTLAVFTLGGWLGGALVPRWERVLP